MNRFFKHLFPPLALRSVFDANALARIERSVAESEKEHSAEIRFVVDLALDMPRLLRGMTAKSRGLEVFSRLRVWDTEKNNGVMIYLLLAEHDIEIIADRGAFRALGEEALKSLCEEIEASLARGQFIEGICDGITRLGKMLAPHYPPAERSANQLVDAPEILL